MVETLILSNKVTGNSLWQVLNDFNLEIPSNVILLALFTKKLLSSEKVFFYFRKLGSS